MKIAVAMSGGVDSSTAAALLKEEGYEVIGLTMRLWDPPGDTPDPGGHGFVPAHVEDARRVAEQIGISHHLVPLQEVFEKDVITYFVEEYLKGRTPNPCVICNERIKFRSLLKKAEELGAERLATGHYARILHDPLTRRYKLCRGLDRRKDQSYFLFLLTQQQLGKALLPLGERSKDEVRKMASLRGLRVAQKSESQEICFIPGDDYRKFVETRMGKEIARPGRILTRQGRELGVHHGIYAYTIGQRRGLGIAAPHPHYVLALDAEKNCVIAGKNEELFSRRLVAREVHWISIPRLTEAMEATVQIRYRHPGTPAVLSPLGENKVQVDLNPPQRAVTPGQAAVFYRGDEVLGGGWIEKAL
jgi:tRNA-uridine 2-sulfurtransferase